MTTTFITPGQLDRALLARTAAGPLKLAVADTAKAGIQASVDCVRALVSRHEPVYGINTGFGKLAQTRIADDQLVQLQKNLVLSHSAGIGAPMSAPVVRLMLLLKAASLAHGVDAVVERRVRALGGVDRHRAHRQRRVEHPLQAQRGMDRQRGRCLRAVEQRETFLGA